VAEKQVKVCVALSRIRGRFFESDGSDHEHYGLPTGMFNARLHGWTLQRRAARIPREG
jgi:hypothetical protein